MRWKLSKFTLHAYSRTTKTFVRWLGREGYVDKELWHEVEMPKVPSNDDVTLEVLSDDKITHLLNLLDPSSDVGCRDRGSLTFFGSTTRLGVVSRGSS